MGRLCERPGCSEVAAMAYGFDVDRLLVWVAPRDPDGDPMRAGSLCLRHADAMIVPIGWTLDDRRDATPRLFRTPASTAAAETAAPAARSPRRRTRAATRSPARDAPDASLHLDAPAEAPPTIAEVTGTSVADADPDATAAIPWIPTFDAGDDLGGVLAARSPLLARAFRGTDRPR